MCLLNHCRHGYRFFFLEFGAMKINRKRLLMTNESSYGGSDSRVAFFLKILFGISKGRSELRVNECEWGRARGTWEFIILGHCHFRICLFVCCCCFYRSKNAKRIILLRTVNPDPVIRLLFVCPFFSFFFVCVFKRNIRMYRSLVSLFLFIFLATWFFGALSSSIVEIRSGIWFQRQLDSSSWLQSLFRIVFMSLLFHSTHPISLYMSSFPRFYCFLAHLFRLCLLSRTITTHLSEGKISFIHCHVWFIGNEESSTHVWR